MHAKPGKGTELAQAMADRCRAVQQEPGCQQFEVFQSALAPNTLVTLELWADQAALDAHAQRNATQPPHPALAALRADGVRPREDYSYYVDNNSTLTMCSNFLEAKHFLSLCLCGRSATPSIPLLCATIVHLPFCYARQSRLSATISSPTPCYLWHPQRCVTPKRVLTPAA